MKLSQLWLEMKQNRKRILRRPKTIVIKKFPPRLRMSQQMRTPPKPSNKSGHIGRKEVTDPTPPADDATNLDKEPVGVWTAEEEDVPKKAPAKESGEEEEDNPAQLKEEGKEDGSSTDDIVGEDIIENEIDTNYLYFVVYRPNKSIEDTSD